MFEILKNEHHCHSNSLGKIKDLMRIFLVFYTHTQTHRHLTYASLTDNFSTLCWCTRNTYSENYTF